MSQVNAKRRPKQLRLKTLLLLAVPAAVVAAITAKWFAAGPNYAEPSAVYVLADGNSLEKMFATFVPNRSFAQTRCRGGASELTSRSGIWSRRFEGGLWSDEASADRALKQLRTKLQNLIRRQGGDYRDSQVREVASRMNGFRFIYTIDDHVGKLEAYYGPETTHPDSQVYRRLYINIHEQTGYGAVDEFQWEASDDAVSNRWQREP